MPLYEYECEACGARFELIRKFSDPPLELCTACGKGPIQKLVSSPAFQFKGSGWYITDYARKSGAGDSKSEGGGTSTTTKTESAPSSGQDGKDSKDSKESKNKESSSDKPAAAPASTPSTTKDS